MHVYTRICSLGMLRRETDASFRVRHKSWLNFTETLPKPQRTGSMKGSKGNETLAVKIVESSAGVLMNTKLSPAT